MWTMAELEPYVSDILDPGCAPTKLVLQYARSMGRRPTVRPSTCR